MDLVREHSNIISLKFCLSWTPRPLLSLYYHFWVNPSPTPNYYSLTLSLHFVSTHFYEFYYIFSIFITYISIIGSDITDPAIPLPPHITQLSLSEPTPRPLSVSDMIFERSLKYLCSTSMVSYRDISKHASLHPKTLFITCLKYVCYI